MAKLSKYQTLQKKMMSQTKPLFALKEGKELCEQLSNGYNEYLRFDRFESTSMDVTWIKQIEDCIPELNDIVSDPKKTIQTLSEVVEVEKAKKTSSESVQHLASHTQFVKKVDEDGNITPSKILTIYNDDFYAIYENKFIATLIRRLFLFVEKRYDYIVNQATMRNVELLYFKNRTIIDGSEIEIETRIKYSMPTAESTEEKMKDFLKRIDNIRTYLRFFSGSEFMKLLHRERDVRNPILQTNIIRKNPKYRKCFHLWQFLNSYMESGVEIKVEEKYSQLDKTQLDEINKVLAMNFLALKGSDAPKEVSKNRIYRPRILKTYDDEMFNPDVNFDGPIEFVRVDEKYRSFNEKLKNLDIHPTKAMQQYMKEDYDENKVKRQLNKENDALLKRKEQDYKRYQKEQEKLLEKEQEDEQMISDLAEQQIQEEQEAALQPYRDALANKGETDEIILPERPEPVPEPEPVIEEEPVVEEEQPLEEETPVEEQPVEEQPEEEVIPEEPEQVEEPQPEEQVEETPVEEVPEEEPVQEEQPQEPESEPEVEEQPMVEEPVEEEPVKKGRGGARPGAGRPRKDQPVEEQPEEEQPQEKKQRGGARPGAGRPRKVVDEESQPIEEEDAPKKQRGGARPGAGRPRKVVEEQPVEEEEPVAQEEEPIVEEQPVIEEPVVEEPVVEEETPIEEEVPVEEEIPEEEPVEEVQEEEELAEEEPEPEPEPEPVARPKPMSKKEQRLARKAEREEKQAKVLNVKSSRAGKKFGRKK